MLKKVKNVKSCGGIDPSFFWLKKGDKTKKVPKIREMLKM